MRAKHRRLKLIKILLSADTVTSSDIKNMLDRICGAVGDRILYSDLDFLQKSGLIEKVGKEGRVNLWEVKHPELRVLFKHYLYRDRITEQSLEKDAIGRYITARLKPEDTLFLDAGSTCFHIARCLAERGEILNVITNNLAIWYLMDHPLKWSMTGGRFEPAYMLFAGSSAEDYIKDEQLPIAIVGTRGVVPEKGLFAGDRLHTRFKEAFIESSELIYIPADHTKIERATGWCFTKENPKSVWCKSILVTDNNVDEKQYKAKLQNLFKAKEIVIVDKKGNSVEETEQWYFDAKIIEEVQERLLKLIESEQPMHESELEEMCGKNVSPEIVHLALFELENLLLIKKDYQAKTYQRIPQKLEDMFPEGVRSRCASNKKYKQAIAKYVVRELVTDGCLLLDAGSTTAMIANELCEQRKYKTRVVTNNLIVALYFALKQAPIICDIIGGEFNPNTMGLVGERAAQGITDLIADVGILGTSEISPEGEPLCRTESEFSFKGNIVKCSKRLIIPIDHTKILRFRGGRSFLNFQDLEKLRREAIIVTDKEILRFRDKEEVKKLASIFEDRLIVVNNRGERINGDFNR